ncbi:flavin reductase family protein [Haliea sp. E1-2-M8]|uniref:flavin reductase family protein n=1 Tax=Haliea sp. E1-2-M8 TaxID=3064706 RepID=UPI002716204C|nr:flavin reductase family protein [Haliea sp. E1-2-M8]MDO8861897.1 flavin reductase family protein [Haliea sp. E1-2-M8]
MELDVRELRNALGRFATGVCLITAVTEEGEALALTANSFSSVSLDPPLVLWNLQNNSEVFGAYSGARNYAINVLAGNQQELSSRYARKGDHLLDPEHFTPGENGGAPIIHDALVSFECSLDATHPGGDHLIIVGRVDAMHVRPEGEPLVFFSGAYRALA